MTTGSVVFGATALGAVGSDAAVGACGAFTIADEPSPSTILVILGADMTVSGGFMALSFKYTSLEDTAVTVYDGPNGTGSVLWTSVILEVGSFSECGDPAGIYGLWRSFAALFSGGEVAGSAIFSTDSAGLLSLLFLDDMVIALVPPLTTSPTANTPALAAHPTSPHETSHEGASAKGRRHRPQEWDEGQPDAPREEEEKISPIGFFFTASIPPSSIDPAI